MAFDAVASVTRTLMQTLQHQRLILENKQEIESLLEEVMLLQNSLGNSSQRNREIVKYWESQIISAAHEAKDLFESNVKDQLVRENNFLISSERFNKLKTEIDFINQLVMKIQEVSGKEDLQPMICSPPSEPAIVGLRDDVLEIKDRLARASSELETLSIYGMAGIGKAVVAREVFNSSRAVYHFNIRAWVTLAQYYDLRQSTFWIP